MIKLLKHLNAKDRGAVVLSAVLIFCHVWLDLKLPDYMTVITESLSSGNGNVKTVLAAGGNMTACALGSLVTAVAVGYLAAGISSRFSRNLREHVYDKVMSFGNEEMNRFTEASLITRTTNDITNVQMFLSVSIQAAVKAPIMAVMAVTKISSKSIEWTVLTVCVVAVIVILLSGVMIYALPRFKRIQLLTDSLNAVTGENISGILTVRAYNAQKYHIDKFEKVNSSLTRTNLQAHTAMALMNPGLDLLMNGLSLGIYWIGAVLIVSTASISDRIEVFSEMVVFISYAMQVVMAFIMLVIVFIMLPRTAVSARRINEVVNTSVSLAEGSRHRGEEGKKGEVEFKNVSFRYPGSDKYVLKDISFKVKSGETLAIIGATGSGKSTVINLIPRLYDAAEGEVLVNGADVKQYGKTALNNIIGFVPQKAYLFSGSVKDNVGYGDADISDSDAFRALDTAQAGDFVRKLENGIEAKVAQTGSNFSGGQKQRLSIARAIAKRPDILVFDDSFSALDYKTDKALRAALKKECADATNIIVAQRISTVMDADIILVIDNGRIVGKGTHTELMNSCEIYKEIAMSQLSQEELAV